MALIEVLAPFDHATRVLSGQHYQTLSLSFIYFRSLYKNLETRYSINEEPDDDDPHKHSKTTSYYNLCNSLKTILLKALNVYDKKHVPIDQKEFSLVSILIY